MKKVTIEFLSDYDNSGTPCKKGQRFSAGEDDVQHLIEDGTCRVIPSEELKAEQERNQRGVTLYELEKPEESAATEQVVRKVLDEKLQEITTKTRPNTGKPESEYNKTGGYDSFSQFAMDVFHSGTQKGRSERFVKWNQHVKQTGMSEGIGADGGFLVPVEFRAQLLMDSLEATILASRAFNIPVSTNKVQIPAVNESTHAGSTFGGVTLYRPDEGGSKTSSKPALARVELTLHKLVGLCYATDELLEDSPITVGPLITRMFSEAIRFQIDNDFVNGTGANQPLGVLAAPCLVSQAKETGQAATTIVTDNVTKMFSRLKPRSLGNSIWIAASDTFPQLAKLSVAVGTGGSAVGWINPNAGGIAGAPTMTLLGRPVFLTEHCPTLGTVGDIILGDWSQYLFAQKGGIKADTSIHLKFDYDETAFRFVLRYDGQPWETSALTPANSSANTQSSFVALATRA
jgi:HK97 family phage major capsid protein